MATSPRHCSVLHTPFHANPRVVASCFTLRWPLLAWRPTSSMRISSSSTLKTLVELKLPFSRYIHSKSHSTRVLVKASEKETESSGVGDEPIVLHSRELSKSDILKNKVSVGAALLSLGFIMGPLLDGIHSNVQLVIYDQGAIDIGFLHTSVVVPPLLAIFYCFVGLIQLGGVAFFEGALTNTSLQRVVLSLISLIIIIEISAAMYKAGVPYNIESYVLFALAELNWLLFDGTWWGFALAAIIGVGCPLSEIPLMKFFNLWHYPKANVEVFGEGLVTWVLICYFSYTPFLSNLSRWLSLQFSTQKSE